MLEFLEPTFFDTRNYQNPDASVPPGFDPFENAPESISEWADNVRARLKAKREAKKNKQLNEGRDRDLPVIETSSTLPTDEFLPVIEAIEALPVIENGSSLPTDEFLPVIENSQPLDHQTIPEKKRSKNSGCIGTYRKGKSEYYRYSYRIDGKVKHRHIGGTSCKHTRHTVAVINRYILSEIPSRWILYNFFDGPDYPERDDDFYGAYQKLGSFPYELPPLPTPPTDTPKSSTQRIEEL
jgi:hypothetical protein